MTPQQYLDAYQGQSLLYNQSDPSLRGQCVQAVCFYVTRNGKPVIWADAYQWFAGAQFPDAYERINNTPDAVPQPGDLIVWGPTLPGSGGAGHIAVCLQPLPGTGTFISVDQNWGGQTVHKVTHTYAYIVGWLRFKNAVAALSSVSTPTQAQQTEGDEMITTQDEAVKLYKMLRPNYAGPTQDELNATVNKRSFAQFLNDAQNEVTSRDTQLQSLETQLTTDASEIGQLHQTIADLQAQHTQQTAQIATLQQLNQPPAPAVPAADPQPAQPAKSNPLFALIAKLLRIKQS